MYVSFQKSPGKWSVGYYNSIGNWIHDSDHDSRTEATQRVVFLNGNKIAKFSNKSLTIQEVINFIDLISQSPNTENKRNLCRLKNVLTLLLNSYLYTDQLDRDIFLRTKNSGQITWLLYMKILCDLKIHRINSKNELIEI